MKKELKILHLEDNPKDGELVHAMIGAAGLACAITRVKTRADFTTALEQNQFDLIISDHTLPSFDGLSALKLAKATCPDCPLIFVSGTLGEEAAIESLKHGAADYVLKDRLARLPAVIQRALDDAAEKGARKRAEEQIREQAALLDKARDAIYVCDLENRITYWNKSAERLYGWPPAEAIGKNADELLSRQESSQLGEARRRVLEQGEWAGDLNQVAKDGKPIIVESRWALVQDSAGKPKARLVINTDITEKKKLEAQFLRAQRMESIGALAGGIAHDLNNALAPIMMGLQLLREDISPEVKTRMLDTMKASAQRGSEMVKQILSFARGAVGELATLDLKHVVAEMDKLARETFPRSIQIQTRVAKDLYRVSGNATHLHQVLLNLCVNARDAMPTGGLLKIEADNATLDQKTTSSQAEPVSGRHVVLTVSDTGEGMAVELLNKIFEPFFTTKAPGKGTGLGLSTVRNIIKSHGGFLEVSSELGKGTTFVVYLPAMPTGETPPTAGKPPPLPGQGEQILVADDELAVLEMTRASLESFNYRVLTARNGTEAVALYQRHMGEIRAVITDMMMPVMDGPTAVHALQKLDPLVRIIAISGLGSESAVNRAGSLKVADFLRKPFTTDQLLTTLRQVLEAAPKA